MQLPASHQRVLCVLPFIISFNPIVGTPAPAQTSGAVSLSKESLALMTTYKSVADCQQNQGILDGPSGVHKSWRTDDDDKPPCRELNEYLHTGFGAITYTPLVSSINCALIVYKNEDCSVTEGPSTWKRYDKDSGPCAPGPPEAPVSFNYVCDGPSP